jgi:LmbE family N-acetylglucosaminyl deacetylase
VRALAVGLALAVAGCARITLTPRLEVPPAARAVVIAPHPDDETLAAGGLIQRILASGGRVRVIVVTEGDGYLEAAAALSGHPTPSTLDYRTLGKTRLAELRQAMRTLGVLDTDVVRLQEPDGGMSELWTDHWSAKAPYWSPHSGRGPFAGDSLYARLCAALVAARPTIVVAPDRGDIHPDHAFTGRFTEAAVGCLAKRPQVLTYVVHDVVWPPPVGKGDRLSPPRGPPFDSERWVSLELTDEELQRKRLALGAYRSQWPVLGGLLARFLRVNEVFATPGSAVDDDEP